MGLGRYANAIVRSPDRHYKVADPAMRTAILQLRSDPKASAMPAGALGVPPTGPQSPGQKVQVFDLFTDTRPNERKLLGDKA